MTAAHALDALETAEARAMEDHLRTCVECRMALDAWKDTANSLAFATETDEPSTAVRARILQQVRSIPDSEPKRDNGSFVSVTNKNTESRSNVIPLPVPSRERWNRRPALVSIAASLVVMLLMVALALLWQRNRNMNAEVVRLSREVNESQQELERMLEDKKLLTAPTTRVASLAGTEMAKGARAMLAVDHFTGRAMLVANGLPPVPPGKAYQLWFIREGKAPMPGGVFATDDTGHAELRDVVPIEGRDATVYAVTLERAGGVAAPEGKAYLQGNAS